jgi:hypothetical protein
MQNYTITASITFPDGMPRQWQTRFDAISYRAALDAAWAAISDVLDAEGIQGTDGLKMSIMGPDVPANAPVPGDPVAYV